MIGASSVNVKTQQMNNLLRFFHLPQGGRYCINGNCRYLQDQAPAAQLSFEVLHLLAHLVDEQLQFHGGVGEFLDRSL